MNRLLIEEYQPKAVIISELGVANNVAHAYKLEPIKTLRMDYPEKSNVRLIEHYKDTQRPWFFTKHWSASRSFTKDQKRDIESYIHESHS